MEPQQHHQRPFASPQARPTPRQIETPGAGTTPWSYAPPRTTEESPRIAPTERSMPPEAITIAIPSAMIPISVSCAPMLVTKFEVVRKYGEAT